MKLLRRFKFYSGAVILLFVFLNVMAYFHAYRMTHFVARGVRTNGPEKLTAWQRIGTLLTGVTIPKPACRGVPDGLKYRTVKIDGRLEAWDIEGGNDVVLMFHGHAVEKSTLLDNARVFHDLGLRCILVDFRGCGGSDGDITTLGWDESHDVAATLAWARQEYPQAHIILEGESMGASALMRAIATEGIKPDAIMVECVFDRLSTTVAHRNNAMYIPAFPLVQLLLFWGGVQHGFNPFDHNPIDYAKSVSIPALVVGGEFDPWVKPAETQAVAAAMPGPATVHVFAKAGHGAYFWQAPDEYRTTVKEWLSTVRSGWSKLSR